jgi:hypothetical protein
MSTLIPQRTDKVVLYLDADQHEIDRLRDSVQKAIETSRTPLRLGDDDTVATRLATLKEFANEAAERGVTVEVKSIGRKWRAMVAEHPPREENAQDAEWGWNVATLADAVVPLCVVSIGGQAIEGEALQAEIDAMSDGDFSRVYSAAVRLNTGRGPDPTELNSIELPTSSPETSESPERLG